MTLPRVNRKKHAQGCDNCEGSGDPSFAASSGQNKSLHEGRQHHCGGELLSTW